MKLKPTSNFVIPNKDVHAGDTITLLNEGEYRKLPQDPNKEVLTFKVEVPSGEEKSLTMNPTSQRRLERAWGDETKNWIDKKCQVKIVQQQVFNEIRDVIYLFPAESGDKKEIPEEDIPV